MDVLKRVAGAALRGRNRRGRKGSGGLLAAGTGPSKGDLPVEDRVITNIGVVPVIPNSMKLTLGAAGVAGAVLLGSRNKKRRAKRRHRGGSQRVSSLPPGEAAGGALAEGSIEELHVGQGEEVRLDYEGEGEYQRGPEPTPIQLPEPLQWVLCDETFPVSVARLWQATMGHNSAQQGSLGSDTSSSGVQEGSGSAAEGAGGGQSGGESSFQRKMHAAKHNKVLTDGPWLKAHGRWTRSFSYVTPLKKNFVGPSEAETFESLRCVAKQRGGYVVNVTAVTPKVPFGANFHCELQIAATCQGKGASRLRVSGRVVFTGGVGPLKGTISSASRQGMQETYRLYTDLLHKHFEEEDENNRGLPPGGQNGASASRSAGAGSATALGQGRGVGASVLGAAGTGLRAAFSVQALLFALLAAVVVLVLQVRALVERLEALQGGVIARAV